MAKNNEFDLNSIDISKIDIGEVEGGYDGKQGPVEVKQADEARLSDTDELYSSLEELESMAESECLLFEEHAAYSEDDYDIEIDFYAGYDEDDKE